MRLFGDRGQLTQSERAAEVLALVSAVSGLGAIALHAGPGL